MKPVNIILAFTILLSINLVMSAPPSLTQVNTVGGIQVFYPKYSYAQQNANFSLHFHVSNISNGIPITNTLADCYIHLYYNNGSHLFESKALEKDSNGWDYEVLILSGNFSTLGERAYYIWCNATAQDLGGEASGIFEVTYSGYKAESGILILGYTIFFCIILFFAIFQVLKTLGLWVDLEVDILDFATSLGIYFIVFAFYGFNRLYLSNALINDMVDIFLYVGAITHVLVPALALGTSLIFNPFRKQKKDVWANGKKI